MARQQKDVSYDVAEQLKDAGLVAASAAATVAAVAKVIDLGLNGRTDARVIIDTTAIEVDTGDELYTLILQLSSSPTFASDIVNAGEVQFGHSATTLESVSTPAVSRRELAFCNEVNGVLRQYCRMFTKVAGTVVTGINYTAFIGMQS